MTAAPSRRLIMSAEEWDNYQPPSGADAVIGSAGNPIVRPGTKNLIEGAEKKLKTTFLMRLLMGLACGVTVFPPLPVPRARKVLYLHGELSPQEIKDRNRAAQSGLPQPITALRQGRDLDAHLISPGGQQVIREIVEAERPEVLVIDPWQSFISGYDENSYKDISVAMHFLDCLIEEHKLTVFIAIHQGKDPARGARGTSALAGWRDTLFRLD